jgi:hypothetical protein
VKRAALQLVVALVLIVGAVVLFFAAHPLLAIALMLIGWATLGSLVVRGMDVPPGEGGPPPGVDSF